MKKSSQTNKIIGIDWLSYHPYESPSLIDNYYLVMCDKVYKILQQNGIKRYIKNAFEEKELACMLVCYFEDVISETHLFSSFTRNHKKLYGKELPFYHTSDDYYDDEINLHDIKNISIIGFTSIR